MSRGVLAAGVGNIFFGDDAFGVEVARQLATEPLPEGVHVADFGIRGVHLAYELLEGYDTVVLVDAVPRGDEPGTLFVIEPDIDGLAPAVPGAPVMDAHSLTPDAVFALLKTLGGRLDRALVVGCEPADTEERMGLSEPVAAAVAPAVRLVRKLLVELTETLQTPRIE